MVFIRIGKTSHSTRLLSSVWRYMACTLPHYPSNIPSKREGDCMKSRMPLIYIAMLILAGCSHTIPETTSKPQPPAQLGKTPPVIQPLSANQKQAQAPESLLPVTLTADLTPVQKSIQSALPEQFTEEHHPLANDYRWRFIREGEPQVQIQDGLVKFNATYRGEIESTAA